MVSQGHEVDLLNFHLVFARPTLLAFGSYLCLINFVLEMAVKEIEKTRTEIEEGEACHVTETGTEGMKISCWQLVFTA